MDVKKVFRSVSDKLLSDFTISSEIKHQGSKGTFRESALREFLGSGRLPRRYGIGFGEIIGTTRNVSRQSDLIVYDQHNGLALITNNSVQVYPIESVYGIIEVKSSLSKSELFKALDNIKSVKELRPEGNLVHQMPGLTVSSERPMPFGIVFAYRLADNSLNSLCENLKEWEAGVSPEYWPNLIVVLDEGIIYHIKGFTNCIKSEEIDNRCFASYLAFEKDSLFQFYMYLLDLCSSMKLEVPELRQYYNPAEKIGPYTIKNHDRFGRVENGKQGGRGKYRLSLAFIEKLVSWCKLQGKISQKDLLLKQMGCIPKGMDDPCLEYEVYHYDPDKLPGIHQIEHFQIEKLPELLSKGRFLLPSHYVEIDREIYYFPMAYLSGSDLEEIE